MNRPRKKRKMGYRGVCFGLLARLGSGTSPISDNFGTGRFGCAINFDRMGYGLAARTESECGGCPDEHAVYKAAKLNCQDMTLVEDIPQCREVVGHLCRELTTQLSSLGYQLRSAACGLPANENTKK